MPTESRRVNFDAFLYGYYRIFMKRSFKEGMM